MAHPQGPLRAGRLRCSSSRVRVVQSGGRSTLSASARGGVGCAFRWATTLGYRFTLRHLGQPTNQVALHARKDEHA